MTESKNTLSSKSIMDIHEFIKLANAITYDFTNDGANAAYIDLTNVLEKFFVYMAVANAYDSTEENIMKFGADYSNKCKSIYKNIPDPDSQSKLLQEIYSLLWDDFHLQYCKCNDTVTGETMNSQNTTLGALYKLIETPQHIEERQMLKAGRGFQRISIRYILSRYAQDTRGQSALFDKIKGMQCFLSVYHTLGNFIPVPPGCNGPRGTGKLKDYWDLTLKVIYDYFVCDTDNIKDIVGEQKHDLYKTWLDSFQDTHSGKNSWNNFVEKNYLHDFVFSHGEDKGYGIPKELWKGHFSQEVLPSTIEQVEQFYTNVSASIIERGKKMLTKLHVKVQKGMA